MSKTKISWSDRVWNLISGCTRCSLGCRRCYARSMTRRLRGMGQKKYAAGFDTVVIHDWCLEQPYAWPGSSTVFVCSMSDLFHEDVPEEFIRRVFKVMVETPQNTYLLLTKRAERLAEMAPRLPWPKNVFAGVTVEHARYAYRIPLLRQVPAALRFLSIEPMLGSMPDLDLEGIGLVILGGESGPGSKAMPEKWAIDVRDQCLKAGVLFHFKQWGGGKANGRLLESKVWDDMPIADFDEFDNCA
jgi:protein gp37